MSRIYRIRLKFPLKEIIQEHINDRKMNGKDLESMELIFELYNKIERQTKIQKFNQKVFQTCLKLLSVTLQYIILREPWKLQKYIDCKNNTLRGHDGSKRTRACKSRFVYTVQRNDQGNIGVN